MSKVISIKGSPVRAALDSQSLIARYARLQDCLLAGRQPVDLPAQDEMKDDQREKAGYRDWREWIDQQDQCGYDPNDPEHRARRGIALAKGRSREHGHPEGNQTKRHEDEPGNEQRIE